MSSLLSKTSPKFSSKADRLRDGQNGYTNSAGHTSNHIITVNSFSWNYNYYTIHLTQARQNIFISSHFSMHSAGRSIRIRITSSN